MPERAGQQSLSASLNFPGRRERQPDGRGGVGRGFVVSPNDGSRCAALVALREELVGK